MFAARPISASSRTVRSGRSRRASLIALLVILPGVPAMAQTGLRPSLTGTSSPTPPTPPTAEQLKQREQELEAARAAQKAAAEAQERLKADITALGEDRGKLNQQLIDVAAQVRSVEVRVGEAETRLRGLDGREQDLRTSLEARRTEIIEVLAALQRAGRRTPPALLVRPEDALQSLRTAMLLGAVIPEM